MPFKDPIRSKQYHRDYTRKWRLLHPEKNKVPRPLWERVALEVHDLTGLPQKTADLAVKTVFEAMKEALLRGEDVQVNGFGCFRVRTRKSYTTRLAGLIVGKVANKNMVKTQRVVQVPPKKYLYFRPAKALLAMLNAEAPYVPNKKQRELLQRWKMNGN
ncbi:HU family DNA-binding protein [Candidatus Microgenomates bacterium]|nr:HU family DNA-binding protein [Candidatus Microgenomates bacterium]